MNILFVTPYLPYPPISGGRIQTFLRLLYLKKKGHTVFLLTFAKSEEEVHILELKDILDDVCAVVPRSDFMKTRYLFRKSLLYEIFTYDRRFDEALKGYVHGRNVDIAVFEGLGIAHYRDVVSGIPSILYEHNVEHELVDQLAAMRKSFSEILKGNWDEKVQDLYLCLFGRREKSLVRRLELRSLREFDLSITCSHRDAVILNGDSNDACQVTIPWCVEIPSKWHRPEKKNQYDLVFVGSMHWEPNRDAVLWFTKEVFPLIREKMKNVRLLIGGSYMSNGMHALDNKRDIIVTGFVPDTSKFLIDADIFVAPIRFGGGVKVKIIDAMSYGVPVITTTKGAEGLEARHGEHFLIADSPKEFVENIRLLIENVELRRSLGIKAREYVLEHHDINRGIELLEEYLLRVCTGGRIT
jgi:glycosyltransferase involved in cell wall biosynthesis